MLMVLDAGKSKLKVPADLVSDEGLLFASNGIFYFFLTIFYSKFYLFYK